MLYVPGYSQRAAARYEIDAKRIGVSLVDRDALPRGREFVRLDSTYYVGWLYQGMYLQDRSVDVAGYERATPFLRKAFTLMEKDFSGMLQSLYNDPVFYMQNNTRYNDYLVLCRALREAYEYQEKPDSAMWVLKQIENKNFRRDFFGIYGARAWIIHRNRFYTSKQYSFLGNSVEENEQRALQECYKGFEFIKRNAPANNQWFGEYHSQMDRQFIYHYLALIHCYLKNYDSSLYYYESMASNGMVSWNNYGSLKAEIGEFAEAAEMYSRDQFKYGGAKNLMEPYYYLPILSVYAGQPKQAIKTATEAIQFSNSSPGFGWYNIALARAYLYDGQLDSAEVTLNKAANFKEVHIGTTLTQPQYEFTIGLLRLVWYYKKMDELKFLHSNWWYNPAKLYELAELNSKRYLHEYVLATQLALNPERARIIYDLFCGESTVGYDEIFVLMQRYSPRYFIQLMEEYSKNDPRTNIKRYYNLYNALLTESIGKKRQAKEQLENLLNTIRLDTAHEKLYLARLYEGLWQAAVKEKNKPEQIKFQNLLFNTYPSLMPFTGLPIHMKISVTGADNASLQKVQNELMATALVPENNERVPEALITFKQKGIKYEAVVQVNDANGQLKIGPEKFIFMQPEGAGAELALRIFGKGGALELEPPPKPGAK